MFPDCDSKAVLLVPPFLQNALRWLKSQSSGAVCSVKLDYCCLWDRRSVPQGCHSHTINHFFLQGSARSQPESTGPCLVLCLMLLEISLQAESETFLEILYVWWELDKAASCYITFSPPNACMWLLFNHSIQFVFGCEERGRGKQVKSRPPWKFCITHGKNGAALNVLIHGDRGLVPILRTLHSAPTTRNCCLLVIISWLTPMSCMLSRERYLGIWCHHMFSLPYLWPRHSSGPERCCGAHGSWP